MTELDETDVQVGAALRAARLARGLRQDDLARMLEVDRSTVARYEAGERAMSVSTLVQVARLLNRPVYALLPGLQTNEALTRIIQLLEHRPDLLPRVLDVIAVSLEQEREEQRDNWPLADRPEGVKTDEHHLDDTMF
jgi:transcriptional regulator with XRE-family HTH domain